MHMTNSIEQRIEALQQRSTEIAEQITALEAKLLALAFDEEKVAATRARKELDRLRGQWDGIEAAILEGERRLRLETDEKFQADKKAIRIEIARVEAGMAKTAKQLDDALKNIEAAWLTYKDQSANRGNLLADLHADGRRRDRDILTLKRELLSAMWALSPKASGAVGLAFVPGNKRRCFSDSQFQALRGT